MRSAVCGEGEKDWGEKNVNPPWHIYDVC